MSTISSSQLNMGINSGFEAAQRSLLPALSIVAKLLVAGFAGGLQLI